MKLGVIGIPSEVASDIVLNLQIRWPVLELVELDSNRQIPDLDLVLVGKDNLPLPQQVRKIRSDWNGVIIAISTQASEQELVHTLAEHADEYIAASAKGPEIVSRVEAVLRRTGSLQKTNGTARAGQLYINIDTFEAYLDEGPIYLTPTEFRLLYHLVNCQGRVLTHEALQGLIWGPSETYDSGMLLRKYIHRLRAKLKSDSCSQVNIMTLPRIGYKLHVSSGQGSAQGGRSRHD